MVSQSRLELVREIAAALLLVTVTKKSSEFQRALLRMMFPHIGAEVAVGVFVIVGVLVGVRVKVGVIVLVGVFVFTRVLVADGVSVLVGVLVGVGVNVFVGTTKPPPGGFGLPAGWTICAILKDSLIPAR